ncbi:hypothetical protein [Streptomyces canus]|uniref:hypothetical protein n=1 Tax=Streptomyces canus TaxID=58343 RepID=UPI003CE908A2
MTAPAKSFTADAAERAKLRELLYVLFAREVSEVRITRVRWPEGKRWVAMVIGTEGREIPVRDGGLHHTAAIILRDAFPHANWSVAQDYDATAGVLREHTVRMPASLRGDER